VAFYGRHVVPALLNRAAEKNWNWTKGGQSSKLPCFCAWSYGRFDCKFKRARSRKEKKFTRCTTARNHDLPIFKMWGLYHHFRDQSFPHCRSENKWGDWPKVPASHPQNWGPPRKTFAMRWARFSPTTSESVARTRQATDRVVFEKVFDSQNLDPKMRARVTSFSTRLKKKPTIIPGRRREPTRVNGPGHSGNKFNCENGGGRGT